MLAKRLPYDALTRVAIDGPAYDLARSDDAQARNRSSSASCSHNEVTAPRDRRRAGEHCFELRSSSEAIRAFAPRQTRPSFSFKQRVGHDLSRGAPGLRRDRREFSSARESRACACDGSWMVDKYVSWPPTLCSHRKKPGITTRSVTVCQIAPYLRRGSRRARFSCG